MVWDFPHSMCLHGICWHILTGKGIIPGRQGKSPQEGSCADLVWERFIFFSQVWIINLVASPFISRTSRTGASASRRACPPQKYRISDDCHSPVIRVWGAAAGIPNATLRCRVRSCWYTSSRVYRHRCPPGAWGRGVWELGETRRCWRGRGTGPFRMLAQPVGTPEKADAQVFLRRQPPTTVDGWGGGGMPTAGGAGGRTGGTRPGEGG